MKIGDMVKHISDIKKPRGVITSMHPEGGCLVQWGDGQLIHYSGDSLSDLVPLGWNLYVK